MVISLPQTAVGRVSSPESLVRSHCSLVTRQPRVWAECSEELRDGFGLRMKEESVEKKASVGPQLRHE